MNTLLRKGKLKPRFIKWYGWKRDLPDVRDKVLLTIVKPADLPPVIDLMPKCPNPYDQGTLGSCTANCIAGAIEFDQIKQAITQATPSRLFIYYGERVIEGSVSQDAGAQIRDGIKVVAKLGAPPETLWPYMVKNFATKPPAPVYKVAKKHQSVKYQSVIHTLSDIKAALASGYPICFGFSVYQSFESPAVAKTGILGMPKPTEAMIGGHAVLMVGYDDSKEIFYVRNSWGSNWGQAGYFTIPYAYVANPRLASDFWVITQQEG